MRTGGEDRGGGDGTDGDGAVFEDVHDSDVFGRGGRCECE